MRLLLVATLFALSGSSAFACAGGHSHAAPAVKSAKQPVAAEKPKAGYVMAHSRCGGSVWIKKKSS